MALECFGWLRDITHSNKLQHSPPATGAGPRGAIGELDLPPAEARILRALKNDVRP